MSSYYSFHRLPEEEVEAAVAAKRAELMAALEAEKADGDK